MPKITVHGGPTHVEADGLPDVEVLDDAAAPADVDELSEEPDPIDLDDDSDTTPAGPRPRSGRHEAKS